MQFQQYQKEMKPSEEEKDTHYQINNTFVLNTENKDSSFINDPYKDDFIIQRSSFVKIDLKYNTPDNLIEMFKQLDGQHVEKIDVLSKYIHDISLNEGCQYISNQTGFTRRCQIYLCQFHNTKYQCPASVTYYYDKSANKIFLDNMNNAHPHAIGQIFPHKTKNIHTKEHN